MKRTLFVLLLLASSASAQDLHISWVVHSIGPDSLNDYPHSLALGQGGEIIVTGVRRSALSLDDIVTMKLATDGTLLWSACYDGTAHKSDKPTQLVLDRYGYVYVGGTSRGKVGLLESDDGVVVKYHPTGEQAWVWRFEGGNNSQDAMNGIAVDPQRNVLAAIRRIEYPTLTMNELVTCKLHPTGVEAWSETLPVHRWSECFGIRTDNQGDAILGGWLWQGVGNPDYEFFALAKYDHNGSFLWFSPFRDSSAWSANGEVFTPDEAGNIFAAGVTEKITREEVFATGKYDASGVQVWYKEFLLEDNSYPEVVDIATDVDGNVYWLAVMSTDSTDDDMVVAKYLSNGDPAWVHVFSMEGAQTPTAITVDQEGNLYAVCEAQVTDNVWGFIVAKLDRSGTVEWTTIWQAEGSYCEPYDIAVDQDNNVIVLSSADFDTNITSISIWKFRQPDVTGIPAQPRVQGPSGFGLDQNFPNPFNPVTVITYRLPSRSHVQLRVVNVLGEEVALLVNEIQGQGAFSVEFDASHLPSGIYFYSLHAGGNVAAKKLVLLK